MLMIVGGCVFNSNNVPEKIVRSTVFVEVESIYGEFWSGSGFIVKEDGLIMTAGHVVNNAKTIRVILSDGVVFEAASFYSKDYPDADIGFIKIEANNLPVLRLSKERLKLGDIVYICGCPFGKDLTQTLTKGIIAGFNRDISELGSKNLLQVDAQSWPGNSGGPICDEEGNVVGILISGMYGCDGISLCTTVNVCIVALDKYLLEMSFGEIK